MNVGSLFAGIGGFDLGFARCGIPTIWQVEQDAYCRAVLAQHFPETQRYEDVREVGAHNLAPVDLICGGFPCQDLSSAGRGAGLDGARSGLWGEFARIIRELRPRYVVVENVPALLTGKGKRWDRAPIGRVLGDLAEAGYDAEWARLSAREFGAPHLRKRVWIVAYASRDAEAGPASPAGSEWQRAGEGGAQGGEGGRPFGSGAALAHAEGEPKRAGSGESAPPEEWRGRSRNGGGARGAVADAERRRREGRATEQRRDDPERAPTVRREGAENAARGGEEEGLVEGPPASASWSAEPDVGRVADGVPNRVDRLAALGNALVPQIAEWIGWRIIAYEGQRSGVLAP